MSNRFLTCQEIARVALPMLSNNLVFPALTYRDYSSEFGAKGDTIQVRKPAAFTAADFSSTISTQDVNEGSVLVKLDKIADVSVALGAKEMALNIENFTEQIIAPAMLAIAEKINTDGLKLYKDIPYRVGTAGTTPDALEDFANAAKSLNKRKTPMTDRYAVWDPEALAKFQTLDAVVNAEKSGTTEALRNGSIGKIIGLDNYMSQAVAAHTAGALTAGGTSATGAKVKSAVTAGKSVVLISNASASGTLTGSLKAGDVLTLGSGGSAVVATVAEDATAADNEITVKLHESVTVSANDAVAIGSNYTANLAFHKNAFAFVNRPLAPAQGAESYVTSYNGLSVRVTMGYDMTYKSQTLSIDCLYGYKTLYPELACVVLG